MEQGQEEREQPTSYMELLLGNLDGYDMENAIFKDINVGIAPSMQLQN